VTPSLTPEQLLLMADEFCATHRVQIRDFGALVAAAAVPGAHIAGISVYEGTAASGRALAEAVTRLEPLSDHNREFGEACGKLYRILHS